MLADWRHIMQEEPLHDICQVGKTIRCDMAKPRFK
jgi:hypothetical protein